MRSISNITEKMIAYSKGDLHDIHHFLRVWAYAKTIGELEGLEEETQFILEAAARQEQQPGHDLHQPGPGLFYRLFRQRDHLGNLISSV